MGTMFFCEAVDIFLWCPTKRWRIYSHKLHATTPAKRKKYRHIESCVSREVKEVRRAWLHWLSICFVLVQDLLWVCPSQVEVALQDGAGKGSENHVGIWWARHRVMHSKVTSSAKVSDVSCVYQVDLVLYDEQYFVHGLNDGLSIFAIKNGGGACKDAVECKWGWGVLCIGTRNECTIWAWIVEMQRSVSETLKSVMHDVWVFCNSTINASLDG